MLDLRDAYIVVDKTVSSSLKGLGFSRVIIGPATGSDGLEALHVTIVLKGDDYKKVNGDHALDTIVKVQHDLRNSGEERFPIIDFATEEELATNDDSES